jgi:hypothetical protein
MQYSPTPLVETRKWKVRPPDTVAVLNIQTSLIDSDVTLARDDTLK